MNLEMFVVAYKEPEVTQKAIDSFRNTGGDCKVTVLDNSPERLFFEFAEDRYFFPWNPSLTRVWNWAIAMAKTDWVLICNSDVEFKKGWLEKFQSQEHMGQGLVHNHFYAFFINKEAVRRVGWFDERFTDGYYEDLDYVRRLYCAGLPWIMDSFVNEIEHQHRADAPRFPSVVNPVWYQKKWGDMKRFNELSISHCGQALEPEHNWYPHVQL